MKKIVLILICIVAVTANIFSQNNKKTDWEKDGLKDKVKSIETKKCKELDKRECYDTIESSKYDENGKIVEKVFLTYGGIGAIATFKDKYHYKYNDVGLVIESYHYTYNYIDNKYEYVGKSIYKYDKKEKYTERYLADGSLSSTSITKYDNKGNVLEENFYNAENGNLYKKETYEYDNKGNLITKCFFSYRDRKETYEYDNNRNLITECAYHFYSSGEEYLVYKNIYEYDNKGNVIKKSNYFSEKYAPIDYKKKYKYDSKGNWVERIEYGETMSNQIYKRTIEYYE